MENLNFNETLQELENIYIQSNISTWIPSAKKNVDFKELSTKQQKQILTSSLDQNIYKKSFNIELNKIIKENSIEPEKINFTTIDRILIAISLKNQIDGIYTYEENGETVQFDLAKILNLVKKNYKHPHEVEITKANFSASLHIPTLTEEEAYEKEILRDETKLKDVKQLQHIVGEAFVGEISKYLTTLVVKEKNISIDFSEYSFSERMQIIEKIPAFFIKEILNQISTWKKELDQFLTEKTKTNKEISLKIEPQFFIN